MCDTRGEANRAKVCIEIINEHPEVLKYFEYFQFIKDRLEVKVERGFYSAVFYMAFHNVRLKSYAVSSKELQKVCGKNLKGESGKPYNSWGLWNNIHIPYISYKLSCISKRKDHNYIIPSQYIYALRLWYYYIEDRTLDGKIKPNIVELFECMVPIFDKGNTYGDLITELQDILNKRILAAGPRAYLPSLRNPKTFKNLLDNGFAYFIR
jgi:hypothetical protein